MTNISDLIARWDTDEGKPYKGKLIDLDAYARAPDDIGCMCAQGQVLHLIGGWKPDRLNNVRQIKADEATAKLLNISRAHSVLLRIVNDQTEGAPAVVLRDTAKVLGGQWSKILDFWVHVDNMTAKQWAAARDAAVAAAWAAAWEATGVVAREAAGAAAWAAAWEATGAAAREAAGAAAWAVAWEATGVVAREAAGAAARAAAWDAAWASSEIQGAELMRAKGTPLFFLPAFGFDGLSAIPPRPANYGETT